EVGSRHDKQQDDIQNGEHQLFHGFPLWVKAPNACRPKLCSGFGTTTCIKSKTSALWLRRLAPPLPP
ncbi:hypothetical protein AB9F42_34330, partial [Rhizobium leguminosarum]|uniref:hypothetical protein n=1 Tax=Rhizobium leguminosarum TaxID=384 RepID=UPI003F9C0D1C